jgi:hypothetical protein
VRDEEDKTARIGSVRVTVPGRSVDSQARPARPALERVLFVASVLERLGFRVVSRGRFGVVVEGPAELFLSTLHIAPDEAPSQELTDPVEPLRGLVDLVEILPPPKRYGRS